MVEENAPGFLAMSAPSPEQLLVLAAIERFMGDPDLALSDEPDQSADVVDAIISSLAKVIPAEEIELAVTGLLATHTGSLEDETQLVLEALLATIERDDEELALDELLALEAPLIEANALAPGSLLVWDPRDTPPLQELEILDLLERYPCRGEGARWSPDDFVALLEARSLEWRRTLVALEIQQEHPDSRPSASTVILVVPVQANSPLEHLEVALSLSGGL